MVDRNELEETVLQFIREQIIASPEQDLGPEDNLFTSGYVDSLGIMRLIAHLETSLGLEIPLIDRVPDNFRTARLMAKYLASRLDRRA